MGPKTPPAFLEDYVAFSLANSIPTVIIIITTSSLYQNFTELALSLQIDTWHSPAIFNFLHQRPAVKISWNPPLATFSEFMRGKYSTSKLVEATPKWSSNIFLQIMLWRKLKIYPSANGGWHLKWYCMILSWGKSLRPIKAHKLA